MLDDIDRVLLQVLQCDGQVSYEFGKGVLVGLSDLKQEPEFPRLTGTAGGIQRNHSIIALSSAKETRETDTTVPGTAQ